MEVFPDLPGLDMRVKRQTFYSTKVLTTASGKELRASWFGPTPRYKYELTFNVLRQNVGQATYDELAVLQGFFDLHRGSYAEFLFDDPVDDVQRTCRFVDDEFDASRIVDRVWEAQKLELVSLK